MITELKPNQIFVFGSNDLGNHAGGAAYLAYNKFGALWGVPRGPQGQCWAIATLDAEMQRLSIHQISLQVEQLMRIATLNTTKEFLVTKIGCGIAGFSEKDIATLFKGYRPNNIILPDGW